MVESETILKQFREKVSEKITLKEKGVGRYLVQTPFIFEDGDHLVIILKYDKESKIWKLTDEGHTFMHISYFMEIKDVKKGTRNEIVSNCKKMFGVEENEGELFLLIKDNKFGDSLFDFLQSLLKIADITFLERERVASTFMEDFRKTLTAIAKKRKLEIEFNWYSDKDKRKHYPIDAHMKVNQEELFIFAINNDARCLMATISTLMFEKWGTNFHSIGIFENQEDISTKTLSKFLDVAEKQVSSLDNIDRFEKYIEQYQSA